jgi:hypothetical protein
MTKVSQEMLAEIGSTRSQVSMFINKFWKLGFINYNGHLEIHNSLLSLVLHETPAIKGIAKGKQIKLSVPAAVWHFLFFGHRMPGFRHP